MNIFVTFIFFALINFWCVLCTAQTYSNIISDKDITRFIKQVSKNLEPKAKKIDEKIIVWTEKDIFGEEDSIYDMGALTQGIIENEFIKRNFSQKDLKFLVKQQENLEWSMWQLKNFQSYELIDSIGFAKILSKSYERKKVGNNYFYSFSIPLFSINQEVAIIQQEYFCGFECLNYCIIIYKNNTNNKTWEEVARLKCL